MTDRINEFRDLAVQSRKLAAESPIQEIRDRNLKLAEMLDQAAAEIEDGDAFLWTLQEVVLSLPGQLDGDYLSTGVGGTTHH